MPTGQLIGISYKKSVVSLLISLLFVITGSAQPSVKSFAEAGHNNIFDRGYFSYAILPSYDIKDDSFDAGLLFSFGGDRETNFGGYSLRYTRRFSLLRQSFAVSGAYLWVPFSTDLRETNWSIVLNYTLPHFRFALGNNYRTYRFRRSFMLSDESATGNYRIIEPGNLMYVFQYRLNNEEKLWNLMFSATNNDYFIIEQEINPMIILKGTYRFKENLTSFIDIGYKSAGFLCIKVDYFGYFLRLGMKWDISKKQDI
ncbi:MAG: hypothetical protein WCE64_09460 [Bacteroidales bacterium]